MSEKPILFSAPMVKAILDGRKTQTRRVVKPQPVGVNPNGGLIFPGGQRGPAEHLVCSFHKGMNLWVRETWKIASHPTAPYSGIAIEYRAGGTRYLDFDEFDAAIKWVDEGAPWRPSIHMPRWASRITLRITSVRVERLQEISEEDAKAEGLTQRTFRDGRGVETAGFVFRELWDSINGTKHPWESNPWVWVIGFEKGSEAIDAAMEDEK